MLSQSSKQFNVPFNSIIEIFDHSVEKYPRRPALVLPDKTWSYEELSRIVYTAIHRMKDHLCIPGCRIAIIGNNHPAYVIAYFAAQGLDATTVEVSRNESLDTIINIIKEAGIIFAVTDRDDLRNALGRHIHVESFKEFLFACELYDNGKKKTKKKQKTLMIIERHQLFILQEPQEVQKELY